MNAAPPAAEPASRLRKRGWIAAAIVWLALLAASLAWDWRQIDLRAAPATVARSARWQQGATLVWHALFGALGLAAVGLGYRRLRRSRAALAISEERYRLISSVATDYVFWSAVQPDGRLELHWVAGAFENITGYAFAEYVARGGWQAMVHPDDRAQDARDLETLRANRPLRSELRTLAKDGRTVWVEVAAHPVWDEKRQRLAGIYGAVKDVTRRKQAEAEAQATYETLNQFVDSVPAFAAYVDAEERYRFVNRYHENWFKDSRRHFIDRKLEEVHRPSTYAIMRPYSRRALAGESVRYEHEMTGRDGKYYCFDVQYVPRRASDGTVLGYFSLVFDVTERVLRDRQLLRTQRLESVGRLASGIAHDLNNILAPMLMGPDLLLETVRSPAERKLLELIKANAPRGAAILRQLQMFGRGEPQARAPLRLDGWIRDMLKIIEETFPKNVAVRQAIAPDLPPILGNVTHLHQVLMNLCINARDAMPDGGQLTLTAQLETVDDALAHAYGGAAGPHVVLGVEDTGSGIPPDVLDKIFDPFFTTKRRNGRTGGGGRSAARPRRMRPAGGRRGVRPAGRAADSRAKRLSGGRSRRRCRSAGGVRARAGALSAGPHGPDDARTGWRHAAAPPAGNRADAQGDRHDRRPHAGRSGARRGIGIRGLPDQTVRSARAAGDPAPHLGFLTVPAPANQNCLASAPAFGP